MALSGVAGGSSINWTISGLSEPIENYSAFRVTTSDGKSDTGPTTSLSTGPHAFNAVITGTAEAFTNAWYPAGSATVTMPGPPVPPDSAPTGISASRGNHSSNVSWNSVTNATGYHVYANDNAGSGDVWKTSTSGLSASITLDRDYWIYTIKVQAYNTHGNGPSSSGTNVRTRDTVAPNVSGIATLIPGDDHVRVEDIEFGNDPSPGDGGLASGIAGYRIYYQVEPGGTIIFSGFAAGVTVALYTVTGLSFETTYRIILRALDNDGNEASTANQSSGVVTTLPERPENWDWVYRGLDPVTELPVTGTTKSSGYGFYLTASEWNGFLNRIHAFEDYKGEPHFSFTAASTGNNFTATQFNQAVNAISILDPATSPPSLVSSGQDITASMMNLLRTSLNSV